MKDGNYNVTPNPVIEENLLNTRNFNFLEFSLKFFSLLIGAFIAFLIVTNILHPSPATENDFLDLEQNMYAIETNPSILLSAQFPFSLRSNNQNKIITFENTKCKIIATYSSDFTLIKHVREDKFEGYGSIILIFVLTTGVTCYIMYNILHYLAYEVFKKAY